MKVYFINPSKSSISWTSQIGDRQLNGEFEYVNGDLISELGKVVGGQITIDLKSLRLNAPSLPQEERRMMEKTAKTSTLMDGDDTTATYKIEEVIPKEDHEQIKGVLMFKNLAFGLNVKSNFDTSDKELKADGRIQVSKSNPVLIAELDRIFKEQLQDDTSFNDFKLDCHLVASEK